MWLSAAGGHRSSVLGLAIKGQDRSLNPGGELGGASGTLGHRVRGNNDVARCGGVLLAVAILPGVAGTPARPTCTRTRSPPASHRRRSYSGGCASRAGLLAAFHDHPNPCGLHPPGRCTDARACLPLRLAAPTDDQRQPQTASGNSDNQ